MLVSEAMLKEARQAAQQMIESGDRVKAVCGGFFVLAAGADPSAFSIWHEFTLGGRPFWIAWEAEKETKWDAPA